MKHIIFLFTFFWVGLHGKEIFHDFPEMPKRKFQYHSPTQRYIDYWGWENISQGLKSNCLSMRYRNLFDRIYRKEELGFIGYHGSKQEFRIYQDIIRIIFEEILDISFRENFHLFRIPQQDKYISKNLEGPLCYCSDQFLCLNFSLYGNFDNQSDCSYFYFCQNRSNRDLDYTNLIRPLFNILSIDESEILSLFSIGREYLSGEQGVLYCLYDMSHYDPSKPEYAFADRYFRHSGAFEDEHTVSMPFSEVLASDILNGHGRLLLTGRHSLNPFSSLLVYRYDLVENSVVRSYIADLRRAVCHLSFSEEKAKSYRQYLLELWQVNL